MKCLVVLLPILALCAGSAIPLVPGDNSHYVEGESRYIWMEGKNGEPVLVDLHEPIDESAVSKARNGALNQYHLYTRQNPNNPQLLVHGNANSVWSSNYNANRPLKVIIHGWNNNGNSDVNVLVRQAFLDQGDYNVICVDWSHLAGNVNYASVAAGVPDIGKHIGEFVLWLFSTSGGNWGNTHFVGHSLGAHAAGNAGRATNNRPRRVTGLDPAGPLWGNNANALNSGDGDYVEAIHTDGGALGIFDPIADADFYPNGGRNFQPGCLTSLCSHSRAYQFFASTIRYNHLYGRQCNNLWDAQNVNCDGNWFIMGTSVLNKYGHYGDIQNPARITFWFWQNYWTHKSGQTTGRTAGSVFSLARHTLTK